MRIFLSKTLKIDLFDGIHFLQDHIGTNYKSPWNDYDYITTFNVYHVAEKQKIYLGAIKLLVKDFKDTSIYLIKNGIAVSDDKIYDISSSLDPSITVSIATDINYYNKIKKLFGSALAMQYLQSVCDVSHNNENILDYKKWPGFNESLLREGPSAEVVIKKGVAIVLGRYTPSETFEIKISPKEASIEEIVFKFSNETDFGLSNINLLIGKNGVGKTHILRNLTELITGIHHDPNNLPYFHKLLVAAYSPFECFYTKQALVKALHDTTTQNGTIDRRSLKSINRRLLHINKYEYIGFKNEIGDFSLSRPREHSAASIIKILQFDLENKWWSEKGRFDVLLATLRLCINFDDIGIKSNDGNYIKFTQSPPLDKKSLATIRETADFASGVFFFKKDLPLPLSSGQIIYSYLIPCLIAEIEDESLVIIDEPELYLHPTLEVGLIKMLKNLLRATSSYAIIATHSAVMAREIEKGQITILKNRNNITEAHKPTFQTLGESLELIIGEAFDDYITEKPYQQDIDNILSKAKNNETVIAQLRSRIGDEALAYLISKLSNSSTFELQESDDIS